MSSTEPTRDRRSGPPQLQIRPERGFVLRVPPETASVPIARSAVRRTVRFANDDMASRYNNAFTEILINAIEAEQQAPDPRHVTIVADLTNVPSFAVMNRSNGTVRDLPIRSIGAVEDTTGERGRGLLIATTLVPDTEIVVDESMVIVTLPLLGFGTAI